MRAGAASGASFGADEGGPAWLRPDAPDPGREENGGKASIFLLW